MAFLTEVDDYFSGCGTMAILHLSTRSPQLRRPRARPGGAERADILLRFGAG